MKIEIAEYESSKLINDLKFEKGIEVDEKMEIEIRLEKLKKIPEKTINVLKNQFFQINICITFKKTRLIVYVNHALPRLYLR